VLIAAALLWSALASAEGRPYLGRMVDEVLHELGAHGLRLIYSSETVTPGMRVEREPRAGTPEQVLDDVLAWTANLGYRGYSNAAVEEIFNTGALNEMVGKAASGAETPERALDIAHAHCEKVRANWRARGEVWPGCRAEPLSRGGDSANSPRSLTHRYSALFSALPTVVRNT